MPMFSYDWANGYIAPFVPCDDQHIIYALQAIRRIFTINPETITDEQFVQHISEINQIELGPQPSSSQEEEEKVVATEQLEHSLANNINDSSTSEQTSEISPGRSHVVYDLGCGDGRVLIAFSKV